MAFDDWQVVVTQSGDRGLNLTKRLRQRGVSATHLPLIVTESLKEDYIKCQLNQLDMPVDGWIFTSVTAAQIFVDIFRGLHEWKSSEPKWSKPICYCIGERTAACLSRAGFSVQYFSDVYDASDLANKLVSVSSDPCTYVFVRGKQSRQTLSIVLSEAGHTVIDLVVYDTRQVRTVEPFATPSDKQILWVLFSPSGVQSLVDNLPTIRNSVQAGEHFLLPFGRTTRLAIDKASLPSLDRPSSATHDALLDSILELIR